MDQMKQIMKTQLKLIELLQIQINSLKFKYNYIENKIDSLKAEIKAIKYDINQLKSINPIILIK